MTIREVTHISCHQLLDGHRSVFGPLFSAKASKSALCRKCFVWICHLVTSIASKGLHGGSRLNPKNTLSSDKCRQAGGRQKMAGSSSITLVAPAFVSLGLSIYLDDSGCNCFRRKPADQFNMMSRGKHQTDEDKETCPPGLVIAETSEQAREFANE